MNAKWLRARQTKYTAYVTLYIAVIIAVLVLANYLAQSRNFSYDSTANKQFSLSPQTKKIVGELKHDVTIDYFDKTSNFSGAGGAKDLLDRYSSLSSKVHVNYIDPDKKPQIAKAMGVHTYGTIFVQVNGRKEEAKGLTEEEITGAIVRAMKGGVRTVCVVEGSGEHGLDDTGPDGYSSLKQMLESSNYKTQVIHLVEKAEVPQACTVLLIGGPRLDYIPPAVNAIKTYVENGGRALIALDPPLNMGEEHIADNAALTGQLADWGVSLDRDLVIDTNPVKQLFGFSAAVVLVTSYDSQTIVDPLKNSASAFPLARSMETKSVDKTTVDKLFDSSEDSFGTMNLASQNVDPNAKSNKKGPLTLAAAGTYNSGKPGKDGRFVVIGSSAWMANNILPARSLANRDLFLNMMNWLSSDEDLISIRPKEPEDRRLTMTVAQMRLLMYCSLIGLPLIVIGAGLSVWWKRR
jgi:gliding motility-associatede transport system auxiliary component